MMLHSWNFFLEFLPATLLLFIGFTKTTHHRVAAVAVLIVASLVFASILGVGDALLIVASAILNYAVAFWIEARPKADHLSRLALCTGITANIAVLAYFKYLDFVVDNVNLILGSSYQAGSLGLFPVGLSFLTFQQIAFLVDAYRGQIRQYSVPFSHYLLFSCFFPKQVAGPIVRHQEFFPQMATLPRSVNIGAFLEGLTRFIYGYFEKVVMADSLSSYARPVFDAAASGHPLGLIAAWGGVLAFTFQLYFDFSGYTNMALGVARMVGFVCPKILCLRTKPYP